MHKQRFKEDVARWIFPEQVAPLEQVTWWRSLLLLFRHLPLRAMLWFRFGSWLHDKRVPVLPAMIQRRIYLRFGLEIAVGQDIGGGLYIPHPVGTAMFVTRMGRNCAVIGQVTIGMRNEWGFPTLGDNVYVGAGARVLGTITLGDGVIVGANAVVLEDVPPDTVVVGIPARPIGNRRQAETAS
jgi:serine O-acetyltransferase